MTSLLSIAPDKLWRRIGRPDTPLLIDVTLEEDRGEAPRLVPGAHRRVAAEATAWAGEVARAAAGRGAVVICARGAQLSHGAAAYLRHEGVRAEVLEGGTEAWRQAGLPTVPQAMIPPRDPRGRTVWVTRARPKIDRIACPWLIRRFVDPLAVFLFVAPSEVPAVAERFGAVPFDIEGVFWSHRGETCTFDTMVAEFGLDTEPLQRLAAIVRGADIARPDLAPEAAGLLAVSLGLSRMYADDLEQLEAGLGIYDAFYRWCRDAFDETHNWPATKPGRRRDGGRRGEGRGGGARRSVPRGGGCLVRVAALSFGGPAGQIAVMHRILVDEKRWVGEGRFLHGLNFAMLLPGPEAHQLAIYLGWLLHGVKGGLGGGHALRAAGLPVDPGADVDLRGLGRDRLVAGLFFGLKAAVLAIVLQAVVRIGGRALRSRELVALAAVAFVAIFAFDLPFPAIVLGAGLVGWLGGRAGLAAFRQGGGHGDARGGLTDGESALGAALPGHARPDGLRSLRVPAVFAALWLVPVAALVLGLGAGHVFAALAVFFSKMAVVTFGGAYAVLAYVAQEAVQNHGWLQPGEMLDGLGMAETTPGPLIQVVQFVGFLAAFRDPGGLDPYVAGTLAAVLVTWVTFVPSFLWIFLGAPHVERMRSNPALAGALVAITAAVVGVILNLAVWFALHVIFAEVAVWRAGPLAIDLPVWATVDRAALALVAASAFAVFRLRWPMLAVLGAACAAGLVWFAATGRL
jgi:chromate transporter